jgi:hypothetical protein
MRPWIIKPRNESERAHATLLRNMDCLAEGLAKKAGLPSVALSRSVTTLLRPESLSLAQSEGWRNVVDLHHLP